MTSRTADPVELELQRRHRPTTTAPTDPFDLFSIGPAPAEPRLPPRAADAETPVQRDLIAILIPLARELARTHGTVTVGDVRVLAEQRGLITNTEGAHVLDKLGSLMKRAGLKALPDQYRRTYAGELERSHGNLHRVWAHP